MNDVTQQKIQEAYEKSILNEAKKVKIDFRVSPRRSKMRYYNPKNLHQLVSDYTSEDLKDATIDLLLNSIVIGPLDMEKIVYEILH